MLVRVAVLEALAPRTVLAIFAQSSGDGRTGSVRSSVALAPWRYSLLPRSAAVGARSAAVAEQTTAVGSGRAPAVDRMTQPRPV